MEENYKEVYFDEYCKTCEYAKKPEDEDHCNECLNNPANLCSHKPINYKENKN